MVSDTERNVLSQQQLSINSLHYLLTAIYRNRKSFNLIKFHQSVLSAQIGETKDAIESHSNSYE